MMAASGQVRHQAAQDQAREGESAEMAVVDEVLADLTAEGDELEATVAGLTAAQWALPTPAPSWTIAHQIAHLAP